MRKLILLKTCLDFFFYILIIGGIGVIAMIYVLSTLEATPENPVVLQGNEYLRIDAGVIAISIFMLLAYLIFVYCVFWFRKITRLFMKTKLFDEQVIKGFHRIGIGFLFITLFIYVPDKIYMFFNNANVNSRFNLLGDVFFDTFWFTLILGLFFMVLGTVFKIAKHAKEENELTV